RYARGGVARRQKGRAVLLRQRCEARRGREGRAHAADRRRRRRVRQFVRRSATNGKTAAKTRRQGDEVPASMCGGDPREGTTMNLRRGCVGGLIGAVVWVALPAARGVQEPAASPPPPRAVFDKSCVGCHNQRVKTAGLALDALDPARAGEHAEAWEKVVRKLRTGAMPPPGRPRPDKALTDN